LPLARTRLCRVGIREGAGYVTGQTIIADGGAFLPENGGLMI
jgi:hypothetical protein